MSSKKDDEDEGPLPEEVPQQQLDPAVLRYKLQMLAWIRLGLGAISGVLAGVLGLVTTTSDFPNFNPNAYVGLYLAFFVYIGTYYLAKYGMGIVLPKKDKNKLITQGIGMFVMWFLLFWILYNTYCFTNTSCFTLNLF